MPNTGERAELTGRGNAKEAEVIQQAKKRRSSRRRLSRNQRAWTRRTDGEAPKRDLAIGSERSEVGFIGRW